MSVVSLQQYREKKENEKLVAQVVSDDRPVAGTFRKIKLRFTEWLESTGSLR